MVSSFISAPADAAAVFVCDVLEYSGVSSFLMHGMKDQGVLMIVVLLC